MKGKKRPLVSPPGDAQTPANPYIGLRPYTEQEKDQFFGRDAARKVFLDLVLSTRFTLLFAASGVGKSSLLGAAVLPQLKDPAQENLDAVYCNSWAGDPLVSLREATIRALAAQRRIDAAVLQKQLADRPDLPSFFELCGHLARLPLVVILDQFEEFFHYHRDSPRFPEYKHNLVRLILDESLPVVIVISMREDFALALNAFKPELPTVLFNNFYRLEKLSQEDALLAIEGPVKGIDYRYEPELIERLIKDLAARERSGRPGLYNEAAHYIEPPYLQIICEQLYDLDRRDPDRLLRLSTYEMHGGAKGLLSAYIDRVTAGLTSPRDKQLASHCFSHLATRRGTKVAHTARSLAQDARADEAQMRSVLERLQEARLLRRQEQDEERWYELYHDLFSESIEAWNERYKARERNKKALRAGATILGVGLALYLGQNAAVNLTNQHLRFSAGDGPFGQVELYRGQADKADPFRIKRFHKELGVARYEMEPEQYFNKEEAVFNKEHVYREWVKGRGAPERIEAYRRDGWLVGLDGKADRDSAVGLANRLLGRAKESSTDQYLRSLLALKVPESMDNLISLLLKEDRPELARVLQEQLKPASTPEELYFSMLRGKLKKESCLPQGRLMQRRLLDFVQRGPVRSTENMLRGTIVTCLAKGNTPALAPVLVSVVRRGQSEDRAAALDALPSVLDQATLRDLLALLPNLDDEGRLGVLAKLAKPGAPQEVTDGLHYLVRTNKPNVQAEALRALGEVGEAEDGIAPFLTNPSMLVRYAAAVALPKDSAPKHTEALWDLLVSSSSSSADDQNAIAQQLGRFGDADRLADLWALPKNQQWLVEWFADKPKETIAQLLKPVVHAPKTLDRLMAQADARFKLEVVKYSSTFPPAAALRWLRPLTLVGEPEDVVRDALDLLLKISEADVLQLLQSMLGERDVRRQKIAIQALGRLANPGAALLLARELPGSPPNRLGYLYHALDSEKLVAASTRLIHPKKEQRRAVEPAQRRDMVSI